MYDAAVRAYLNEPDAQEDSTEILRCGGFHKWRVRWLNRINFKTARESAELTRLIGISKLSVEVMSHGSHLRIGGGGTGLSGSGEFHKNLRMSWSSMRIVPAIVLDGRCTSAICDRSLVCDSFISVLLIPLLTCVSLVFVFFIVLPLSC